MGGGVCLFIRFFFFPVQLYINLKDLPSYSSCLCSHSGPAYTCISCWRCGGVLPPQLISRAGQSQKVLTLVCHCPALRRVVVAGLTLRGFSSAGKLPKCRHSCNRMNFCTRVFQSHKSMLSSACSLIKGCVCKKSYVEPYITKIPSAQEVFGNRPTTDLQNVTLLETHFYWHRRLSLCIKNSCPPTAQSSSSDLLYEKTSKTTDTSLGRLIIVIQMRWVNKLGGRGEGSWGEWCFDGGGMKKNIFISKAD